MSPKVVLTSSPSKRSVDRAGDHLARIYAELGARGSTVFDEMTDEEDLEFVQALRLVEWWRQAHAYPMLMVAAGLRYYVRAYTSSGAQLKPVTQRLKKQATILDKLNRLPSMGLTQMADIGGVRVVLPHQDAVDDVLRRVRKNWRASIERVRDYVERPKASGYRAKHVIVVKKERRVEVQLRTPLQDTWANQVEADSRWASNFKAGAGHQAVHDYYVSVSGLFAAREAGSEPNDDFMRDLVERYQRAKPYLPETTR
jgi:putative GTP pyrophosphokinase